MSNVDPLTLFQNSNNIEGLQSRNKNNFKSQKRPRGEYDQDKNIDVEKESNKKMRKKWKKKRKKLEKKLKKRAKKKAKKEEKKAKKKAKKLKKKRRSKTNSSSSSSSSSSEPDDGISDEEEEIYVGKWDENVFNVTVLDILKKNIRMHGALQQVFGALDAGQGIVLGGIENADVKNTLQHVFNVLPIVKHLNGEQSLYRKSDINLKSLLQKLYEQIQKMKADNLMQNYNVDTKNQTIKKNNYNNNNNNNTSSSTIISSNNDVDQINQEISSSDDDDFGPQIANSSKVRGAHRDFTEDEIMRTKKYSKSKSQSNTSNTVGKSKRGDWMTQLPEGRNIFTQMQASTGPRKFLKTSVDRKLASDGGINLWTATPEQRLKIQRDKANKKLLGYDSNFNTTNNNKQVTSGGIVGKINLPQSTNGRKNIVIRQPVQNNNDGTPTLSLLEDHRLRNQSKNNKKGYDGKKGDDTRKRNEQEQNGSWRERELLQGAVDKSHLKSIISGAKNMTNRFSSGKM